MANRAELEAAAAAGIITADQAERVLAFVQARTPALAAPSGEEDLRFIRNFHDVFLAIGILLLAAGLAVATAMFTAPFAKDQGNERALFWIALLGSTALSAGVVWGLGEIFSRRRRLFLPSIAICVAFTGFVVVAVLGLYVSTTIDALRNAHFTWGGGADAPLQMRLGAVVAALAAVGAPLLFYWRFRLPFSLGLTGVGFAALAGASMFLAAPQAFVSALYPLMLLVGALLFAAGVAFDARDPQRSTRLSDNGFWLHMAAAPLLLNGALGCIANIVAPDQGAALMTRGVTLATANLIIVIMLGFVSLLINRRALIVSALVTAGIAVGVLLNAAGLEAMGLATATLLTLGAFVLILGAGWHKVRAALLARVPRGGLMARIFPPEVLE